MPLDSHLWIAYARIASYLQSRYTWLDINFFEDIPMPTFAHQKHGVTTPKAYSFVKPFPWTLTNVPDEISPTPSEAEKEFAAAMLQYHRTAEACHFFGQVLSDKSPDSLSRWMAFGALFNVVEQLYLQAPSALPPKTLSAQAVESIFH